MALSGLEVALIGILGSLFCGAGGWWLGSRGKVSRAECEQIRKRCSVEMMSAEIKRITKLLRLLCEKQGISVKEQIEICDGEGL